MANWYVSSVAYAAVAQWAASTAYSVGQIVRQLATPTVQNERCFRCSVAGTSGATEPTWVITKNGSTVSGTATFIECTGQEAYNTQNNWAAPSAKITHLVIVSSNFAALGDNIYVASNHAESNGSSAVAISAATASSALLFNILCVSPTCSVPPIVSDLSTGATITTGAGVYLYSAYVSGITFVTTATNAAVTFFGGSVKLTNVVFTSNISGGAILNFTSTNSYCDFTNVTLNSTNATNTAGQISAGGIVVWRNSTPIGTQGTGNYFSFVTMQNMANILFDGCDFSAYKQVATNNLVFAGQSPGLITFLNCKMPVTYQTAMYQPGYVCGPTTEIIQSDTTALGAVYKHERHTPFGRQVAKPTYLTGGASDGTNPYSWLVWTHATTCSWVYPFETMPLTTYNTAVGSPTTVTIQGVYNGSTLPTNAQIWMIVEYLGTSGSTFATVLDTGPATLMTAGTPWGANTSASWVGAVNRANSTAYSATSVQTNTLPFTVSSNSLLFFLNTAGTSAASLPATYATATDGTAVTDGTANLRAGMRFQMQALITPQVAGPIRVTLRFGSPNTYWVIDPMIYLS